MDTWKAQEAAAGMQTQSLDQSLKEPRQLSTVHIVSTEKKPMKFAVKDKEYKAMTIGKIVVVDLCHGPIKAHTAKGRKSSSTQKSQLIIGVLLKSLHAQMVTAQPKAAWTPIHLFLWKICHMEVLVIVQILVEHTFHHAMEMKKWS